MAEDFEIIWSHSRLIKITENPKEYYLSYKQGIKPKEDKKSLYIGSAVHEGLEHNNPNLDAFFKEKALFKDQDTVSVEQVMAESMVEAFLKVKPDFLNEILTDSESGEKTEILQEDHELTMTCEVDTRKFKEPHKFQGIIDLLFYTPKGWILCDYKTSSSDPDWTIYKSQLFDYKMLLNKNFPEVPLYKIAIINLQKTKIRQGKKETDDEFKRRIISEYQCNNELIKWHIYDSEEFSEDETNDYLDNLVDMIDLARTIEDEHLYFLNHSATTNMYGKSQYWDVFYHTPNNFMKFKIKDSIFDPNIGELKKERDCVPIDMLTVEKGERVLNKFYQFKKEADSIFSEPNQTKDVLFEELKKKYITDETLLEEYWLTYEQNH